MQDRPDYLELLHAVQQFLENDAVPALEGTKKFHARVAANVLAIVSRELQNDVQLSAEWERLNALLDLHQSAPTDRTVLRCAIDQHTATLCERIRHGDADSGPWREQVVQHVRQTVVDKLVVANPKYLAATSK